MMYPQAAPPVDRRIEGVLIGAEPRQGGWVRFSIQEQGNQYPTKVDTKKKEVIDATMALMMQGLAAEIREQEATPRPDGSHINPNNGKPWINRYLNAVAPAGYAPGVMPTPPTQAAPANVTVTTSQTTPTTGSSATDFVPGLTGQAKDLNVMRQCASKVVAMSWQVLPEEQRTVEGMVAACEAWMAYYQHGPLRFGIQAATYDPQADVKETMARIEAAAANAQENQAYRDQYAAGAPVPCPECGFSDGMHDANCPLGEAA